MDEHQDAIDRLRALGETPVDAELTRTTLASMRAAGEAARTRRTRVAIALAALIGFFGGSVGLASAGALPADVQDTAQAVLERVGVDVPPGHERYNDPTACPGGPYRNHGEYVRTHKDDPNAGASPCGKPVNSINGTDDESDASESETPDASESPGNSQGKGKNKQKDKSASADDSSESEDTSTATTAPETTTTVAPSTTSEVPSTTAQSTAESTASSS